MQARKRMDLVLEAYVEASANTAEKYVTLREVTELLNAKGATFTKGKKDEPMTDRAQKMCLTSASKLYEKVLTANGLSQTAVKKAVKKLGLKKVKDAPSMTKVDGFDFDSFQARLEELAT